MEAIDQVGLKIHLASKKHIMKVAQADSAVNVNRVDISILKNEFVKRPMEKSENVCGLESNNKNGNFRCEICNIEATAQGQLDVHLAGKKHLKKAVQEAAQQRIDSVENVCGKGQLISE